MQYRPILLGLSLIIGTATSASAQLQVRNIDVNGVAREYSYYLPAGYDGTTPQPLMLAFHGGCDSSAGFSFLANFRNLADTDGFIAVYPQGLPEPGDPNCPIWNSVGPYSNGVDDIGYTAAIIDDLAALHNVDESRVYACGYSNGANLCWELACYLSDRIAAIGPVAGSMWEWTEDTCTPTRAVPVVFIHGTQDFYNPYGGGPPFSLGAMAAMQYWAQNANTNPTPTVTDIPNTAPGDGSTVDLYTWADGDGCVSVEHYRVVNGGHDWPGAFGNQDIDSTSVIWEFCSQFDLQGKIDCDPGPPSGCAVTPIGVGAGGANIGSLDLSTTPQLGTTLQFDFSGFNGASSGLLILSLQTVPTPLLGGTIYIDFVNPAATLPVTTGSSGAGSFSFFLGTNPGLAGLTGYAQVGIADASQVAGWAFSNAIAATFCN